MENNPKGSEQVAQEPQDKLTFEKLTPTHLSNEDMKGYTDALDFVFQENDLLNIAITGPYASGKSSVIKTYEENHKNLEGIHISLSYFSPTLESKIKGKKKDDELAFEDELMLERKIINQLVHQIDPDKIPATEFKVKSESKKWTKVIWTGIISLIIFCLIYTKETWFTALFNEYPIITPILIVLSFIFIISVTYTVIELQSGKNLIRKLKIFENEIDISPSNCDVSYFDKYLNEIIYILGKSELDYIVFEDIDRYDDNLILNKLRELNYTYNKKQIKQKPKPIKFLYLIKDEIFESKERTKFFDYILPIVPVMDNSNSLGKMEDIFKSQNILSDFSATFLDTLSLYLDDIRLIKNICNEYLIYKNKLAHGANWFKYENLLAIIVYKNIFPSDFSLTRLGLGQGVVHRIIDSLIKQKSELYTTQIKKIDSEIQLRKENLNTIETSHLRNIEELEALYINVRQNINFSEYKFIGKKDISSLTQKQFFDELKVNDWVIANHRDNNNYYCHKINLLRYYQELEGNPEYQKRKKEVEIVFENKKITFEADVRELEKEKAQLKLPKKITEIIRINQNNGVTVEKIFKKHIGELGLENTKENETFKKYQAEYEKLSSSCYFPLLRVLIIQGYIDEYYSDYTSFFDEQGLPKNDTLFLRNISERINTDWDLELKKPELVLKKLNTDKFNLTENSILNYSLLDYILATNKKDDLSRFINLLGSRTEADFENEYLARYYALLVNEETQYNSKYLCFFIKELNIRLSNIWTHINVFDKKLYLYLSFIHNQQIVLDKMNDNDELKDFIDDSSDFLLLDDEWDTIFNLLDEQQHNLSKIINAFIKLNIKFKRIENSTPQLLKLVEEKNTYQLNEINAKYILENKYNLIDLDTRILQTVLSLKDDASIKLYFQSNPEELVVSITESDTSTINDNEETVLFILNHDEIPSSIKIAYINKLTTIINELSQITDKAVWDKLLEKQRIQYSDKNIIDYFFRYIPNDDDQYFTEKLITFINDSTEIISSNKNNIEVLIPDTDNQYLFFNNIITCNQLNNSKYEMLLSWYKGFKDSFTNFNFKDIDKDKISILIKLRAIRLTEKQDLNFIRENYPDNILELITHNFNDYINKLKNDNSLIDHDEIINLLSIGLSLEQKISLLALTSEPISINNSNYSTEIEQHILDNNFDTDDLAYITSEQFYNSSTNEIKEIIKQRCIEYKTQILELEQICYALLIELFVLEDFSLNDKYILLCNQINHLDVEQNYNAFKIIEKEHSINENCFSDLFILKRPRFEATSLNKKIIEDLNEKWEFTYSIEGNQIIANGRKLINN